LIGKIHSIETLGTVDGPGIRYVIFMQGCNFRCAYCHNPDTWDCDCGSKMSVQQLIEDICKYKRYIEGVTVTGGEPLLQIDFVTELFERVKAEGLSTCIDTNGSVFDINNPDLLNKFDKLLEVTDLVMLDIKHIDGSAHINLTGSDNDKVLNFAKYLSGKNISMWLRYVLVPTINDDMQSLIKWRNFAEKLQNVEKIEVLPYHRMAIEKYAKMGIDYRFKNIQEPTEEQIKYAERILLKGEIDK